MLKSGEKFVNSPAKCEDPIKSALKFARDYKINKFASQLDKFKYANDYSTLKFSHKQLNSSLLFLFRFENNCICFKNNSELVRPVPFTFNRIKYKNLCDIKLKSQDGQVFQAHKCILVARMEYFKLMLSGFWMEVRAHLLTSHSVSSY